MCGNIVCLAAILMGVDARWPPLPDGGLQYVILIEPYALDRHESSAGEAVRSHVPPYVQDVRAYQIVMRTPGSASQAPTPKVHSPIRAGVDTDWVLLPSGGAECRLWITPEVLDELETPGRVIEGEIPADVKKPTIFTISVGTKPPRAESPTTIKANPTESVAAKAEEFPAGEPSADGLSADPPPESLIAPPPESLIAPPPESLISSPLPPDPLPDPAASRSGAGVAEPASHLEHSPTALDDASQAEAEPDSTDQDDPSPQEPATPWPSREITLIGLLASFGGNVFLLWIVWDFRSRYLSLLGQRGDARGTVKGRSSNIKSDG